MNRHQNTHVLFSLSLFLLFVIGSFFIVTYEIRGYQNINEHCIAMDEVTVPIAYLNTKLKANDMDQSVDIVKIEDTECLSISTKRTVTYIYLQDGYLKELYSIKDIEIFLKEGNSLFALDDFQMEREGNLFTFTVKKGQQVYSTNIYLHG